MKKHTPGPWKVGINGNDSLSIWTIAPSTNVVAVLHDVPHENNTKANAHLIAAAPELLEAAKFALRSLEAANDAMGGDQYGEAGITGKYKHTRGYYLECRKELAAAIAKAEGKE